jgi:integrase/recombinase XerD
LPDDSDSIEDFLGYCLVEEGLAPATVRTYRQVLVSFSRWVEARTGEGFEPGSLSRQLVKAWQRWLVSERRFDDATYTKYVSTLRGFLAFLHGEGRTELTRDDAKLPKSHLDLSGVRALTSDEIAALLSAPDPRTPWGSRDRALLALLYCSGMRVAEICALDRGQLPLESLCGSPVLELPIVGKGRKPRVVFIDELAQRLLREYLESRDDELPALFIPFKGPDGKGRLTPRSVQNSLTRYSRKAGLMTAPTPHTLRHTFAVHKLQAGADTRIVQAFLGHSSLATTQRYTRITDRYLRESYERSHKPASI